jgi:hypothetical protein
MWSDHDYMDGPFGWAQRVVDGFLWLVGHIVDWGVTAAGYIGGWLPGWVGTVFGFFVFLVFMLLLLFACNYN